jgi:hypothetical protein
MPTPFPGMDPYLEKRGIWSQVHTQLIVKIQDFLAPQLRPRYTVDIDLTILPPSNGEARAERVGRPDDLILTKPVPTGPTPQSESGGSRTTAPTIEPIVTQWLI